MCHVLCVDVRGPSRGQFFLSIIWDPGLEITSSVLCGKCFTRSAIPAPNMVLTPRVQQKENGKKQVMLLAYYLFLLFLKAYLPAYISKVKKNACYQQNSRTFKPTFGAPAGTQCVAVQCITKRGKRERGEGERGKRKHKE